MAPRKHMPRGNIARRSDVWYLRNEGDKKNTRIHILPATKMVTGLNKLMKSRSNLIIKWHNIMATGAYDPYLGALSLTTRGNPTVQENVIQWARVEPHTVLATQKSSHALSDTQPFPKVGRITSDSIQEQWKWRSDAHFWKFSQKFDKCGEHTQSVWPIALGVDGQISFKFLISARWEPLCQSKIHLRYG